MIGLKERLLQFIAFHMMSVRAFEASCGFKNAWVSDIMSRIDISKVQKISELYPDLNIDWLFTGRGNMLYGLEDPEAYLEEDDLINLRGMPKCPPEPRPKYDEYEDDEFPFPEAPKVQFQSQTNNVFITNWSDLKDIVIAAIRESQK